MSRFQILAADFDQDGIDELVVTVDRKAIVYKKSSSGANYSKLYERTFSTKETKPYDSDVAHNFYGNVRLAVGDVDGDKTPDIAAIYEAPGADTDPSKAAYLWNIEVYPGGNLTLAASYNKSFVHTNGGGYADGSASGRAYQTFEDIKIGNVAGHAVNTIVAMAAQPGNSPTVSLFEYNTAESGKLRNIATYNSGTRESFDTDGGGNTPGVNNFNFNVTLCNFDGTGSQSDIVAGLDFLKFTEDGTSAGTGTLSKKTSNSLSPVHWFVHNDLIAAGNFDGNNQGKEQLSVLHTVLKASWGGSRYTWKQISHDIISVSGTTYNKTSEIEGSEDNVPHCMNMDISGSGSGSNYAMTGVAAEYNNIPVMAVARSAEAAKTLKYKNHDITMSEPRIYALLAAPPFYAYKPDGTPYEYGNFASMGTSWGKSEVSGSATSNSSSNKVSVIFGYENEFNVPIFGTKVGGIDFTTKLEFEWTNSTEKEYTTTKSIEFTAPQNDAVILTASFFDNYTYEITGSGNADEIGSTISVSIPSETRTMGMDLNDYERLAADNTEIPNLRKLFKHTVGYPFTYPNSKTQIVSNVANSTILWAASFGGSEFVSVGSGTDVNRSITLDETTTQTAGFNFNLDMELVGTLAGVKLGAGYGHGESNESSHIEGKGHSISGHVSGLKSIGDSGLKDYRWTVCWYKYKVGNQTFPVVNYVVKE
ncbi:MAG: VCBS repeat-containing protein [Paludibacteraceae bacterium]